MILLGRETVGTPEAAGMRGYAAEFTQRLVDRSRLPLDYSVTSLRMVDVILDGMRRGGTEDRRRVAGTLSGLGAYVGEVLVRRAGAVWVDLDPEQRELFGQPVGIRMPDGRVWNPLGKVANRFTVGAEESVYAFYLMLHGRARPTAA